MVERQKFIQQVGGPPNPSPSKSKDPPSPAAQRQQILVEADAVHGFPTPGGPPTFRNRFVKTQLRLRLSGPFLFTGSDTVVCKPLTPLLNL